MRVVGITLLAGSALAYSKPTRNSDARKAALEARRRSANGDCNNVELRCRKGKGLPTSFSTGCNCHSVYINREGKGEVLAKCILKDPEIMGDAVYESGATGLCRAQMPPCHKRTPEDLFGHCGALPFDPEICFMDCKGPSCMPNYNAKKCMKRPDVCKSFKNDRVKCDKYKRYTESAYAHKACCRKCYRKTEDVPCLLGYLPKNTTKKQGSQGVATWDNEFRHMAEAKTKLCCRIKKSTLARIKAQESLAGEPVFGPTPDGRIEESKCYGVRCGSQGTCNPEDGQCVCFDGYTSSSPDSPCDTEPTTPPPPSDEEVAAAVNARLVAAGAAQCMVPSCMSITLIWDNTTGGQRNDLDLKVQLPDGGVIYYGRTYYGGGRLDVDQQRSTPNPVENIVFADSAAPGLYKIIVNDYISDHSEPKQFTVSVVKPYSNGERVNFTMSTEGPRLQDYQITTFTI